MVLDLWPLLWFVYNQLEVAEFLAAQTALKQDQIKSCPLVSLRFYQIHYCLPWTYDQSIAFLQRLLVS
jgi:hypothetical protein